MFKVECPGCKAPYQVDERRVPAHGLKMRCPKCSTSFKVDPPSDTDAAGPGSALGGALGFFPERDSAPPPALAGSAGRVADARAPLVGTPLTGTPALPHRPGAANLRGTMLGVAPSGAAGPPLPPARPNLKGTMLGVAPAMGVLGKPPPMPARKLATAPVRPVPGAFSDLDLPVAASAMGSAVPVADAQAKSPRTPVDDLPAALDSRSRDDLPRAVAPQPFDDLPAAVAPQPFDDLPAAVAPQTFDDLPTKSALPSTSPLALDLDADLPSFNAPPAARSGESGMEIELDLPTVGGLRASELDLPSASLRPPSVGVGLQAPAPPRALRRASLAPLEAATFGDVELPSLSAALPDVSRAALPSLSEVELPALRRRMPSGGFTLDDDLPLVGGGSSAFGSVNLPERTQAEPPFRGVSGSQSAPAFALAGSNSIRPDSSLETSSRRLSSLADDISDHSAGVPSLPPDFGLEPGSPRESAGANDFGELDLPLTGPATNSQVKRQAARETSADEADPFGEMPGPSRREPSPSRERSALDAAVVRQSGGGTAYGEVNLGDDDDGEAQFPLEAGTGVASPGRDEDMEFGAIPQEDQPKNGVAIHAPVVPGARTPSELPARRRHRTTKLYALAFIVIAGGAALALVPALGPFGYYFISDHLHAGDYARLVSETVSTVEANMAKDTFPDAQQAERALENARLGAKRVRELPAYEALTAYAVELRFGPDPAMHARASVLLGELVEQTDTRYLASARVARAAADGQIARAKQLLDALPQTAPDLERAFLGGEIALRAGDSKAALAIWRRIVAAHRSARGAFGLARANFAAGDGVGAEAAARDALTQNPAHVGARILLARLSSARRTGEAGALGFLDAVTKDEQAASPDELVSALTLRGDIHLARSRMSQAEAAYDEALKINPKAARALNGLGDALYRAGRYSESQARFEASTQADPDDLSAKIGVAKAKLGLERVEDASAMLKKLHDTYPQSVPVAYWYGRALEASGNRALAQTVYRSALNAPSDDPQVVDAYIALALLQTQQGQAADAQKTLADARAKLPDLPAIHKALGEVALSQGRYPEAAAEFRQAILLDDQDLGAKFRLGVALRRDGKFDDAGKEFDGVGAVDREYPGLALERGLLYEASGRSEEALKEYESALARAPKDPDLMLRVGCGKVAAGRPKQAEELLRKVLSDRPNSAETNHCLGRALLIEGTRLSEALRFLDRAVELDSNRAEYQMYVGWAANEAGNVPKAEHALAEALRIDQSLADAYWQRGVLRQRQGAARDAIADLTRAIELRPSRNEAHAALADAYFDLGKEQQALAEWQLAILAEPDNATWRFRYGKLLAANHQTEASREQLSKALDLAANDDPVPRWAWEAHDLLAHAIGLKPEAVKHWQEFLRLGPRDSPYRNEAKSSLEKLGHPWTED